MSGDPRLDRHDSGKTEVIRKSDNHQDLIGKENRGESLKYSSNSSRSMQSHELPQQMRSCQGVVDLNLSDCSDEFKDVWVHVALKA